MQVAHGGDPFLRAGPWITGTRAPWRRKSAGIFADHKTKGTASAVPFVYRDDLSQLTPGTNQTPR